VTDVNVPLFNPRTQRWTDHFGWSADDATVIESQTAVGRATIALLELNAPRRREIRQWLVTLGEP